jgi:CRP-like cAMP-binding protein
VLTDAMASSATGNYNRAMALHPRPVNRLLHSLREDAYQRVAPHLKSVELQARQILYKPNQAIHQVYFPETAVICLMTVMRDGDTLETATVGFEGASWISASIGAPSMPCETIVVIGGEALTLSIADLEREMKENEHFRDILTQYSHALLIHSMRMTGCTGLHTLSQRCARWILTTLDRVQEDRFSVTHEFMAMLLGSSRPSVSIVIEEFERQGILKTARGRVLLGDRTRLLTASCDCYQVIKENYEQVGQ